jgi:hypothetical protein
MKARPDTSIVRAARISGRLNYSRIPALTDADRFMVSLSNHEALHNRAYERLHGSTGSP